MVLVQFAGLAPTPPYLGPRSIKHLFIGGVFPEHEVFDDLKKPLPFDGGFFLVHPVAKTLSRLKAGVVDHLCEYDCPRRSQGTTRPPEVQGTGVTVANGFFTGSRRVDLVQW